MCKRRSDTFHAESVFLIPYYCSHGTNGYLVLDAISAALRFSVAGARSCLAKDRKQFNEEAAAG